MADVAQAKPTNVFVKECVSGIDWPDTSKMEKNHIDKFWEEHPGLDPNELIEINGERKCGWCNQNFKLASGLQSHLNNRRLPPEREPALVAGFRTNALC